MDFIGWRLIREADVWVSRPTITRNPENQYGPYRDLHGSPGPLGTAGNILTGAVGHAFSAAKERSGMASSVPQTNLFNPKFNHNNYLQDHYKNYFELSGKIELNGVDEHKAKTQLIDNMDRRMLLQYIGKSNEFWTPTKEQPSVREEDAQLLLTKKRVDADVVPGQNGTEYLLVKIIYLYPSALGNLKRNISSPMPHF